MMYTHKCLTGCGRNVTWTFAICSACENTYGNSSRLWPAWLRFLWSDTQRERRQTRRVMLHEVSLEPTYEGYTFHDR